MKKHIDKLCLHCNNVITLIKHFIKYKIKRYEKGGNNYVKVVILAEARQETGEREGCLRY